MPSEFWSGRQGDLYLRTEVRVPEQLTREERELYERLRAIARSKPAANNKFSFFGKPN